MMLRGSKDIGGEKGVYIYYVINVNKKMWCYVYVCCVNYGMEMKNKRKKLLPDFGKCRWMGNLIPDISDENLLQLM